MRKLNNFASVQFGNVLLNWKSILSIPISDFPACILGEPPELTADSFVIGATATYSWRNIFSCINLLRVLNKLTKWKHSRIMMLVVFKSAPILKQTLKVRHAMMQLYVLKLLKMQTRYLGRQWRKSNMKTISAIYSKVRHRLNDDWAFGNGTHIAVCDRCGCYNWSFFNCRSRRTTVGLSNWGMFIASVCGSLQQSTLFYQQHGTEYG